MTPMHAKERLYLTADKSRVVRHGDPRAAFLYASVGDEIPQSAADKFGLVDGELPRAKVKPEKTEAEKAAEAQAAAVKKVAAKKAPAGKAAAKKQAAADTPKQEPPAEDKEQKPDENKGAGGAAAT